MARAYSDDLRERFCRALDRGTSARAAARLLEVAYTYIGLGWSAAALLLIVPLFPKTPPAAAASGTHLKEPDTSLLLPGLTFREAIRNSAFQKLSLASLLVSLSIVGTVVHLMPILTLRGLSREVAAGILSTLGIASAVGKLGTGWLFDRVEARPVAALCLSLPAVPLLMLALLPAGDVVWASIAVALLGFSAGAELSATAYLTTCHVGLRAFAQNYSIINSIMALSAGVGPLIAGFIYDSTGGYALLLFGCIPAAFLAGLCIATMGPSPLWHSSAIGEQ